MTDLEALSTRFIDAVRDYELGWLEERLFAELTLT